MDFCCKLITNFINDSRYPLKYNAIFREVSIKSVLKNRHAVLIMDYCPWCGKKLPISLRDEFFDVLENEFGLELSLDEIKTNPNVPEEFKSDLWWKHRSL